MFGIPAALMALAVPGTGDFATRQGDDATGLVATLAVLAMVSGFISWSCHKQVTKIDEELSLRQRANDESDKTYQEQFVGYMTGERTGYGPKQ
jgi:hypothetical protein